MQTGAITQYIDVAQITLYLFWVCFAGIVYYLHRENKREGYPLESDRSVRSSRVKVQGFPAVPAPKHFLLRTGETVSVPRTEPSSVTPRAAASGAWLGAPLVPTGDPMFAGVGPGSIALRADVPDRTFDNHLRLMPLRTTPEMTTAREDTDPRGLPVYGADGVVGGIVKDLWVDRGEMLFRYLEIHLDDGGSVLLPMPFARVMARRVEVKAILGAQFRRVPTTRHADQVTLLEEERIMAFYGAGSLYATPSRQEPLI